MSNQNDLEQLVVQLSADTRQWMKSLEQASQVFDKNTKAILKSQEKLEKRVQTGFRNMAEAARHSLEAIGVGLSFEGMKGFVEHITETAMNIKKQAQALSVSTDAFQAWSLMAKQADVDQEKFNSGMERLIKNFEQAKIKTSDVTKELNMLVKGWRDMSPEQFVYALSDALRKVDAKMRAGLLGKLMGGGGGGNVGVALVPFFQQGSAAMHAQEQIFRQRGELIPEGTLEKIREMDIAWINLKATLSTIGATTLVSFTEQFKTFGRQLGDPNLQAGLKNFGAALGQIAKIIAEHAQLSGVLGLTAAGTAIGGPAGGALAAGASGAMTYREQIRAFMLRRVDIPLDKLNLDAKREGVDLGLPSMHSLNDTLATDKNELDVLEGRRHAVTLEGWQKFVNGGDPRDVPSGGNGNSNKNGTGAVPDGSMRGLEDFTQALDQGTMSFDHAVDHIRDYIASIKMANGGINDYVAAQQKAQARTELLAAAQADAARRGVDVSKEQVAEIDRLAEAYGRARAAQAFAGDLQAFDARIAKLKAEASAAGQTAAKLAELEGREQLLADFHRQYGETATPTAAQSAAMDARAKGYGQETAAQIFAHAITGANKQVDAVQNATKTVGLYEGALAAAQMRVQLLSVAQEAGLPIDQAVIAAITQVSERMGKVSQASIDVQGNTQKQIEVMDTLRNGFENMGVVGVTQFKNLGTAAGQFLEQLAQLIMKLYVMEPLMTKLFGPQDSTGSYSPGGGMIGSAIGWFSGSTTSASGSSSVSSALNSAWNWISSAFADGGVMTSAGPLSLRRYAGGGVANSPQLALYGEGSRPEAYVPLPDGRSIPVNMNMRVPPVPQIPSGSAGSTHVTYAPTIDARGADATAMARLEAAMAQDRAQLPSMIVRTVREAKSRKVLP